MKLIFISIGIALMIQVSLAGPLGGSHDDDHLLEEFEVFIKFMKNTLPLCETIIKDTLKNVPHTDAYSEYRQILQAYLADYDEFKATSGKCIEKTYRVFVKLTRIICKWIGPDASTEAKEIVKLMEASGIEDIRADFREWDQKYDIQPFNKLEERYPQDDPRFKSIYSEVC